MHSLTGKYRCFNFPNPVLTDIQTFPIFDPSKLRSPNQISPLSSRPLPDNAIGKGNKHIDLADATSTTSEISQIPLEADQTFVVYTVITRLARNRNSAYGFFNHTSWRPQTDPPLPLITLDRSKWDANQFSISTGNKPVWIDLVVNNLDEGPHPFHLVSLSELLFHIYTSHYMHQTNHQLSTATISTSFPSSKRILAGDHIIPGNHSLTPPLHHRTISPRPFEEIQCRFRFMGTWC